jgi:hypothetical protein
MVENTMVRKLETLAAGTCLLSVVSVILLLVGKDPVGVCVFAACFYSLCYLGKEGKRKCQSLWCKRCSGSSMG